MINTKTGVGVVIGRFQVADLHEGHRAVIDEARKHRKVCVFVGVQSSRLNTKSDPLDYPTREQMIKNAYPDVQVFELHDQYNDRVWSQDVDRRLGQLYPTDKVTLYAGRDSFKGSYSGKHTVIEIDSIKHLSGTELRSIDGSKVEDHASFRRGMIYAAFNRWDPVYPCVDIACTRVRDNFREVLVGFRHKEGVYRFPGGHIDERDETDVLAARRELQEETGIETTTLQYVWSGKIKAFGDKPGAGHKRTVLFHAEYVHGAAQGADDLDKVLWVKMRDLESLKWADDHAKLARLLLQWLRDKCYPFPL